MTHLKFKLASSSRFTGTPDDGPRAAETNVSKPTPFRRAPGNSRLAPGSPMTVNTKATTVGMSAATRAARGKALLLPQQVDREPRDAAAAIGSTACSAQGGFGQVYLATRLTRSRAVPPVVAIKASGHIDGWLREAYFGQLLDGHSRAIRVFDRFPLVAGGRQRPLLSRARVRAARRPARVPRAHRQGLDRDGPRGARSPGCSRCSASCTAASRSTATSRR